MIQIYMCSMMRSTFKGGYSCIAIDRNKRKIIDMFSMIDRLTKKEYEDEKGLIYVLKLIQEKHFKFQEIEIFVTSIDAYNMYKKAKNQKYGSEELLKVIEEVSNPYEYRYSLKSIRVIDVFNETQTIRWLLKNFILNKQAEVRDAINDLKKIYGIKRK